MPRGLGRRTVSVSCGRGESFGYVLKRSYILLIAWGRPHHRWIEGRPKALRGRLQRGGLLVLIGWNQAVQRQGSRDFGKCGQTFGHFIGLCERRRQYFRIVAAGFRIVLQFLIGHHGRRVRILQIDRIEVELQMKQQRYAGEND